MLFNDALEPRHVAGLYAAYRGANQTNGESEGGCHGGCTALLPRRSAAERRWPTFPPRPPFPLHPAPCS